MRCTVTRQLGAVWLVHFLLFGCARLALCEDKAPKSWRLFNDAISRSASYTISLRPTASRVQLAAAVVQGIHDIYDRGLQTRLGQIGYGYTAFVWTPSIPDEFKNVFVEGGKARGPEVWGARRKILDGAVAAHLCSSSYKDENLQRQGTFGWPCPPGGTVIVKLGPITERHVRCLVFYFPLIQEPDGYLEETGLTFQRCFQKSAEKEPRLQDSGHPLPVNLTNIAFNFYKAELQRTGGNDYKHAPFKAFLCIPVYEANREVASGIQKVFSAANLGISAEAGHIIVDYAPVPMLDLNKMPAEQPFVCLAFIAAIPAGKRAH